MLQNKRDKILDKILFSIMRIKIVKWKKVL